MRPYHCMCPSLLSATLLPFLLITYYYGGINIDTYISFIKTHYWVGIASIPILWMHTFIYSYIWIRPDRYKQICKENLHNKDPVEVYALTSFGIKIVQVIFMITAAIYYKDRKSVV